MKSFSPKHALIALLLVLSSACAYAQESASATRGLSSGTQYTQPATNDSTQQPQASSQSSAEPTENQNTQAPGSSLDLPDKVQPKPDLDVKNAQNSKRIFGIIPNFISTNDTSANEDPLTVREKYVLSYHQMFDFSAHVGNLLQSAISQAANGQPHYGQGWGAFGERLAASEGDQITSCLFIYGVLPSVLHDDPRYFRRGQGSIGSRIWYAASRTVITRKDSGEPTFNVPQTLGQLIQQGISTSYYPAQDRSASGVFTQWGVNLAYNSGYNMLREFMPDLGQYLARRKQKKAAQKAQATSPLTVAANSN